MTPATACFVAHRRVRRGGARAGSSVARRETRDVLSASARADYSTHMPQTESRRGRALLWWGLAAATLILGYADLVRGGETLAPILLIIGYCVLVPLAILRR